MSLKKVSVYDKIEIVGEFAVQCRRKDSVEEDGKELACTFHRHVLSPDSDLSNEDARVKSVCELIFTEDVKQRWIVKRESQKP